MPFDWTTLVFILLAVFVLVRLPMVYRKQPADRDRSDAPPRKIVLGTMLWLALVVTVLAFVTQCQVTDSRRAVVAAVTKAVA